MEDQGKLGIECSSLSQAVSVLTQGEEAISGMQASEGTSKGYRLEGGSHPYTMFCTTHCSWAVQSFMTQLQLAGALKLVEELDNTFLLSSSKCLLPCKMSTT